MSWNSPTWRPLGPDELLDPEAPRDPKARLELWTTSPSGLPVGVSGLGLDMALTVLHMRGYGDEVWTILDRVGEDEMSCTAAVDFFIGYDMAGQVARHLEQFDSACGYVMALPATSSEEYLNERIRRAQDKARTVLANRSATDAISEIGLGLLPRSGA